MPDDNAPLSIARRLVVVGRVQGVSYRASAQAEALRLELRGWVRNRRDGSVEAQVCGPAPVVERFIAWARKGPPGARVDRVDVADVETDGSDSFSIRQTI